jgi:hypothetical protein
MRHYYRNHTIRKHVPPAVDYPEWTFFASESVAADPVSANRAVFAFVIDAFLVRAAQKTVSYRDRFDAKLVKKAEQLGGDRGTFARDTRLDRHVSDERFAVLIKFDAHRHLGRARTVRSIKRDRSSG